MALGIDTADLFDLDSRTAKVEEHLFVLGPLGKRYLLCREPNQAEISALQLTGAGRKGDVAGAARDFLEATILTVEQVDERVALDEDEEPPADEPDAIAEARRLLDEDPDAFVDVEFLLERLSNPEYDFETKHITAISMTIIRRATAFPTKPSSDSSTGRSGTGSRSRAASRRRASTPSD